MEKRFLHPALQADKLFTVMVHKEQEQLAREVLSAYPWFNKVKAVREVRGEIIYRKWSLTGSGKPRIRSQPRWACRYRSSSRMGRSIDRFDRYAQVRGCYSLHDSRNRRNGCRFNVQGLPLPESGIAIWLQLACQLAIRQPLNRSSYPDSKPSRRLSNTTSCFTSYGLWRWYRTHCHFAST